MAKPPCQRCVLSYVPNAEKGVTPVGRWIHRETPCKICVPLYLMPINAEPFNVFLLCRNTFLRGADGKPYDIDVNALANTILAMKYESDCLVTVANLMRHLIYEELI